MKYIKSLRLLMLLVFSAVLVVSCSDENIVDSTTNEGEITPTVTTPQNDLLSRSTTTVSGEGMNFDCFHIEFPFDLLDDAGETYSINSEEDFITLLTDSVNLVDFVYPLTITYEDGSTEEVTDAEGLGAAFAACLPNEWDENSFPAYNISDETSCFTLVYPLALVDLSGNMSTVNDEVEFIAAISAEPLFFSFPLTLIDELGSTFTVANSDELINTLISCNDFDIDTNVWTNDSLDWGGNFEYIGCYLLNFPFDVVLFDGTVVTVNDHMEYCDLLLQGSIAELSFPITLTDIEGGVLIVNNQEELAAAIDECYDGGGSQVEMGDAILLYLISSGLDSTNVNGEEVCYDISYPFNVTEIDFQGNEIQTITVNSLAEFEALPGFLEGTQIYNIVYPITLIHKDTGEIVDIDGIEGIFQALSGC